MPYKDDDRRREAANERSRRYRARKHAEKFGEDAGDMRGRHGNHATGERNARWNGGLATHEDGYLKARVGRGHPLADPNGYAYVHRLVIAAAGIELGPDDVVHHRNGNKQDNRLENLEVLTRSSHADEHWPHRLRNELGQFAGDPSEWPEDLRVREWPKEGVIA